MLDHSRTMAGLGLLILLIAGAQPAALAQNWTFRDSNGCVPGLSQTTRPNPRFYHSMASFVGGVLLFGGSSVHDPSGCYENLVWLNDTWYWNNGWWTPLLTLQQCRQNPSACPEPREGASMAYDPINHVVVLFGGYQPFRSPPYFNDTWIFTATITNQLSGTFTGGHWTKIIPDGLTTAYSPQPRAYASMSSEIVSAFKGSNSAQIVLQGGSSPFTSNGVSGDTWVWDNVSRAWHLRYSANAPQPLTGAGAAFHANTARVVLPGGYSPFFGGSYSINTFTWDGSAWQTQPSGILPQPRTSFGIAGYDAAASVVLYGGYYQSPDCTPGNNPTPCTKADTYTWNGSTWSVRSVSGPGRRARLAIAYDSWHQAVVLFGGLGPYSCDSFGCSATDFSDTWTWGRQAACVPLTGSTVSVGSTVECSFKAGTGATFAGWVADGFGERQSTDLYPVFRTLGPGPAKISATWSDETGPHSQDFLYTITQPNQQ